MEKKFSTFRPVSQEHPMGCAVACVASLCRLRYQKAIGLFDFPEHAWTRGYYCSEVVRALSKVGLNYKFEEFDSLRHSRHLKREGTIVFVAPCAKYPSGHYLLRLAKGWMNPWSNFPMMRPVQAAIEKKPPGKVSYLVYVK